MKKKIRCAWVPEGNELYEKYHDEEWGVPVRDDQKIFEFLVLESAQAGLSWLTVLRKRENYARAFANFNPRIIARWGQKEVEELLKNTGIIRNRAKINATINNAKKFLEVQKEFGTFHKYIWGFVDGKTRLGRVKPIINKWKSLKELPAKTKISDALALDLKRRGFKFLGSTICYAHMQATGMVDDHLMNCFRKSPIKKRARKRR